MIAVLATAAFFLAIVAALQFSTWAEGWLTSKPISIDEQPPDATSPTTGPFPGGEPETVRAA
jgi:hypothetical protein